VLRAPGASGAPGSVGVVGGGAASAATLLWADGPRVRDYKDLGALLAAARGGQVDAALVLASPGDGALKGALAGATDGLELVDVPPPGGTDLAWLRPARIPANTYPGQRAGVDTLSAQVVLAGATAQANALVSGGPAAALPSAGKPLTAAEAEALAEAVGTLELPDPVLPAAAAPPAAAEASAINEAALDTALNVLVLLFLGWLVTLCIAPVSEEPATEEPGPST